MPRGQAVRHGAARPSNVGSSSGWMMVSVGAKTGRVVAASTAASVATTDAEHATCDGQRAARDRPWCPLIAIVRTFCGMFSALAMIAMIGTLIRIISALMRLTSTIIDDHEYPCVAHDV